MFYKVLTPTVTHVFEQLNMFSLLEGANSAPLHSLARFDTSSRKRRGWKGWEKTPPPPRNKYLVTAVSLCSRWCTRHLNVSRRLTCCAWNNCDIRNLWDHSSSSSSSSWASQGVRVRVCSVSVDELIDTMRQCYEVY